MEIKVISLSKIKRSENYRTQSGDLAELMSSIKENGLLQPVGVKKDTDGYFKLIFGNRRFDAYTKLGRKSIECTILDGDKNDIIMNLIENIQRKDTSLFEIGRAIHFLKEEGLSDSEIVVRLGMTDSFIKSSIGVYNMTPKKFRNKVINMDSVQKTSKKGMISSGVASCINSTATRFNLSKKDVEMFYEYASKNDLSVQDTRTIIILMGEGLSLTEALNSKKTVKCFRASLVIRQDEYDRLLNKYGKNFINVIINNQTYDPIKPVSKAINKPVNKISKKVNKPKAVDVMAIVDSIEKIRKL